MSSLCSSSVHRPFLRRFRCATVILTVVAGLHSATAEAPEWWITRNVLTADAADDFAVLNQGQLKNLVRGAIDELNAKLSGTGDGAGLQLNAMLAGWRAAPADNHIAANVGQLKQMGFLVRERLAFMGVPVPPLGTPATADDDDFAPANLGQAKAVFAFEIGNYLESLGGPNADYDQDGLTNSQEFAIGTSPARNDTDGDGMPDPWEVLHTLNPLSPADAGPPTGLVVRPEAPVLPDSSSFYFEDGDGNFTFDEPGYQAAMDAYYAASLTHAAALAAALVIDPDSDRISNLREFLAGTNPRAPDTDGDGFTDMQELDFGGNPNDNGAIPPLTLSIIGGGGQTIQQGDVGSQLVTVKASQGGVPKSNAAITATGQGGLLLGHAAEETTLVGLTNTDGTFVIKVAAAFEAAPGSAAVAVTMAGAQALAVLATVTPLPSTTNWSAPAASNLKFIVYARHNTQSRTIDGFQQFEQVNNPSYQARFFNRRVQTNQTNASAQFSFDDCSESGSFQDAEYIVLTANGGNGVSSASYQGTNPPMRNGTRGYSYSGAHSSQFMNTTSGRQYNFVDSYVSNGPYQTSGTGTLVGMGRVNESSPFLPVSASTQGGYCRSTVMLLDLFAGWYPSIATGPYFAGDQNSYSSDPYSPTQHVGRWTTTNANPGRILYPFSNDSFVSGIASNVRSWAVELEDELDVDSLGRILQGILAGQAWPGSYMRYDPPENGLPSSSFSVHMFPHFGRADMIQNGDGTSYIYGGGFAEGVGSVQGDAMEYYVKLEKLDPQRPVRGNAGPFTLAWNEYYQSNDPGSVRRTVAVRDGSLTYNVPSTHYTLSAVDHGNTTSGRAWLDFTPVVNLALSMEVDINDDHQIAEGERASPDDPFDIYPNDDDDSNKPQPPRRGDFSTSSVDGTEDVKDFFPVFLDLQHAVRALPPSSTVTYRLKQADGALNFMETSLTRSGAFDYRQGSSSTGYGSGLGQPVASASTRQITAAGVPLSTIFLDGVRDLDGRGVILVEARRPSDSPLVLVVEDNGVKVAEFSMPLTLRSRFVLLLHGMNSDARTWNPFVTQFFGDPATTGAETIRDRAIQSATAPLMTDEGLRCYRVQFGSYDSTSTRVGLEGVSAATTPGYLAGVDTTRCGDFETFTQLGQEVDDAITVLRTSTLHPHNDKAQIMLVGHSRGGLSARAFLQSGSTNRANVKALLTTGSPHLGSRMGRIYLWLQTHPRGAAGTDEDDWEVVDQLMENIDMRRPVIEDVASYPTSLSAALTSLNTGAGGLPGDIRYGQLAYQGAEFGFLARQPVTYKVFDVSGINFGEQLSDAAAEFILDPGHASTDYPGDGLIPAAGQLYSTLFTPSTPFYTNIRGDEVLHTEEPARADDLQEALRSIKRTWFPEAAP